jgi:uncharacterized protein (TIGR03000 family)
MYSIVLMAALATTPSTPAWCHGCHGCCGGWGCHGCCSGWGCRGCCSCYGGWGCCSCSGSWGGCHGCYSSSGWGCCSSGCCSYSWGCRGGCYGCYGGYAAAGYAAPVYAVAPTPAPSPTATAAKSNTAQLVVELPADAKLFIDGHDTKASTSRRVFNTPKLETGETYYYEVKAQLVRDGKTYSETKRVTIKANETSKASFTESELVNAKKADHSVVSATR